MPEPLSTTVGICLFGYSALQGYVRRNSAFSPEADKARDNVIELVRQFENSEALFGRTSEALSNLSALADDCAEAGWDGNDALAINHEAVFLAEQFVRALPADIPLPEFAADPDGAVSLDWIASKHRIVSLIIGAQNRISFAWIDGGDKGHGVAQFDGCTVPPIVLQAIHNVLDYGTTSLRAA